MGLLDSIKRLVREPAPGFVFELSEEGIAHGGPGATPGFQPFEPGTLVASPLEENLRDMAGAEAALSAIAPANGNRRRRAALILPDYAARISVLDFDAFPQEPSEQAPLVKFRIKKTVPFDVDSARVGYTVQSRRGGGVSVVAATVAVEILARYEALLRNAGFQLGEVTVSSLAALEMVRETGVTVVAKMSRRVLTVMVVDGGNLKLVRCIETDGAADREILGVLMPTIAYVEDELKTPPARLLYSGFGPAPLFVSALTFPSEPLRGRQGMPGQNNAGLLGYLERVA